MSFNNAMQIGVTGLAANSTALSAISQNIANVNTTAYKRVDNDFQDIVDGTSNTTSYYNGGGVMATTQQTISETGQLQTASSGLDLGIDGQGFFVASNTSAPSSAASSVLFTRDGSFTTDKQGYLVNGSGLYLKGWPVNPDGSVSSDSSDLSKLGPINISNIGGTAEATTEVTINGNLMSSQALSSAVTATPATYDSNTTAGSMASYDVTASPPTGTKPDFELSIPVSDSKGGQQTMTMSVLKTGANTWDYEIWSPNITSANGLGQVAKGTLAFTTDGTLDTANSTSVNMTTGVSGAFNPSLTIGASADTGTDPHWSSALGVSGQTVAMGLNGTSAGLTQYDSASVTQSVTSNGTAFGNLSKIQVGTDGMVTAVFDNGVTRNIAQVALATFINANGLTPVSGNAYSLSRDSGTYSLKVPGLGGAGLLSPSTLEASSVDLSQEFTGLITTQRAYSAASKIITTADQMLQELLSIKQ